MYGCESWTIKKAECWCINTFELWCWRRLLRVPWTVRRSNQSILKEISPAYSSEGLILKLQYFGHLIWRTVIGKDSDAGKEWRREEKGTTEDEMVAWHHQLNEHEFEQAPWVGDGQQNLVCCSPWGRRVGHNWVTELNWTELIHTYMHAYLKYSSLSQQHNWLRAVVFQLKYTVTDWAQGTRKNPLVFY